MMFSKLIEKIDSRVNSKKLPFVIGISGFGGSGKSTLASRLAENYKIKTTQILKVDNLFAKNINSPGFFRQFDWFALEEILKNICSNKQNKSLKLDYIARDNSGEEWHVLEPMPKILIVEGLRLFKPNLMPYFDLTIWVNCSQDKALAQAKARDRSNGVSEEQISLWDSDWAPKDKKFFEEYRPDKNSDIQYSV